MSAKVFNKIMDMFCLDDEVDEVEEVCDKEDEVVAEEEEFENLPRSSSYKSSAKVVNLPTAGNRPKVVIAKPYDFDEAATICDHLKNNRIVVINTKALELKIGQRLLDFIGGASYVLGGQIQEVEKGIYLLMPSNVEVSNTLKYELQNKGVFSFIK